MSARSLPARPSLDQLKRQARELRQSILRADTSAIQRLAPYTALLSDTAQPSLTDAKLVVAREYGFDGWPQLKQRVESLLDDHAEVDRFVDLVHEGDLDQARFMADHGFATMIVESGIDVSLHVAARFDLLERLVHLLAQDPESVGVHDAAGLTPLHLAGSTRICQTLVHNYSADLDARDRTYQATPAQWATIENRPDVARLLVDYGADADVVMHCCLEMLDELDATLERSPALRRGLDLTQMSGGALYARALGASTTLLHAAVHFGSVTATQHLLDVDANIDATDVAGATALHRAATRGLRAGGRERSAPIVQLLLERGASAHAADAQGATPLHRAASAGNAEIAAILLAHGAPVDAVDQNNRTPAATAATTATRPSAGYDGRKGAVEIVRLLLKAGASDKGLQAPTGNEDLDAVLKARA